MSDRIRNSHLQLGQRRQQREIYRLTKEVERLEQRNRTDVDCTMTIYAAHKAEIADLNARHEAELERLGRANATEFARGVEWERQRPEREAKREAQIARWEKKRQAELAQLAAEWS